MTQIKFTTTGANSAFGGFTAGDTMRCADELAKHLVDMGCAKYMDAFDPKAESKPVTPRKGKK